MTAIALRDATDDVVLHQPTDLAVWAEQARQAANVAISLAKTPFVPASLRDRDPGVTAANITAAILTGQEIGLEPMAALRSIDVIQGTPALRAMTMRAVVLSAGHEMWVAESTASRAIVRGRRRGTDQVQESVWTTDRARGLNLLGKDNWKKQPAAMLIARATSECARLIAADALLGVPYAIEELDDGAIGETVDAPASAPARRTARRRSTPAPAQAHRPEAPVEPQPEPSFDDDEPTHSDGEPDTITEPQMKWLQAHYRSVDRDTRLNEAADILGLNVPPDSFSSLTKAQASTLIDTLEQAKTDEPGDGDLFDEPQQ